MPTFFPAKMQKPHLAGLIAVLGMVAVFINAAIAITAFTPQEQPVGYVAQDEMSNYNLTSGHEILFRPEYEREKWSGNLYAYPVDAAGNLDLIGERWVGGARAQIDGQDPDTGRKIATMKSDGTKVPFRAASFTTGGPQYTSLETTVLGTLYSPEQIVNFLRGDRSNENTDTKLRARRSVLGDIMHTRPYYIEDASQTIFVGANDGMLHAINATNGEERWAYIPSMLIHKLKALAANPYLHNYYVDGQINIARINNSATRILVGGLGGGERGLYALNITSLTATTEQEVADKILWEINPSRVNSVSYANPTVQHAYTNLGYIYGTPTITKVHGGSGADIDAVIVGNGYNSSNGNCNPSSATTGAGATLATTVSDCQAYLYVINAATGQRIMAIKAYNNGTTNTTAVNGTNGSPNGLSTPAAVDINGDGAIDRVYAGDLNGTMWKFDLSDPEPQNWSTSVLHTTDPVQPITGTPGIAVHPKGGYMVNFGTGTAFTGVYGTYDRASSTWTTPSSGDLGNTATHYVYGIWDDPTVAGGSLVAQALAERSYIHSDNHTTRVRRSTANAPNWATDKGWKVPLPAGERVVGDGSFIENGRFYFNSYNPTVAPFHVSGTDTDIYGENWLMELNYLTGGSSTEPFLDMDGNLLLNSSDRIKYIAGDTPIPADCDVTVPDIAKSATCAITSPNEGGIPVGKFISRGVQSQPILVQLQTLNTTLFNQNPDVIFPPLPTDERGVRGGHFDVDIYFGANNNCRNVSAVGYIDFVYGNARSFSNFSIRVGGNEILTAHNPPEMTRGELEIWVAEHYDSGSDSKYKLSVSNDRINVVAKDTGADYDATITVSAENLISGYVSITDVAGGADASPENTRCTAETHLHQYDDIYDKTGLNMLNASSRNMNLARAIPEMDTRFKVLMANQYLSPAARLHIGNSSYLPNSPDGYISVKDFQTSATLDITDNIAVPTYTRNTIGSLAINLPTEGFVAKDWWGGATADARAGLHPTNFSCVINSSGAAADMYNPVEPPANGADGPGVGGPEADAGARHNGALTVQIIKRDTPQDAIEQNVAGRPEYGYRVKHKKFYRWVLVEYNIYWHHPNAACYHTTPASQDWATRNVDGHAWNTTAVMAGRGFSKRPPEDTAPSTAASPPAANSTDPKLSMTSVTDPTVNGVTATHIVYADGSRAEVVRTENSDGTVTIVTIMIDAQGNRGEPSTRIIASGAGSVKTGGDERGLQSRTGRISWHELIRD